MQEKLKLTPVSWSGIIVLLGLIVCVRLFERNLFYDPFLSFFKAVDKTPPEYSSTKLFFGYAFRYLLNTVFSLGIIWLLFKDKGIIKLTVVLYLTVFIVLATALFITLSASPSSHQLIFYLRRFLIQPLLLLLFVPAFCYQRYMK